MENSEAFEVLAGIKKLISNPPRDNAVRHELYQNLKELADLVEDPHDTIYRIAYSPMNLVTAQIARDLNIFGILTNAKSPISLKELCLITAADEILLGRIMRFLASQRMIKETDEDIFAANSVTRTLSNPGFQAGISHNFEVMMPCWQALPQFLADTKYVNPSDVLHSAFQIAHRTEQPAFVWAMGQPKQYADFNLWMTEAHQHTTSFLDVLDMKELLGDATDDDIIFVDVAGGIGQQCALLKTKLPNLKGRVILQDLHMAIDQAMLAPGVEKQVVDMWEGQSVRGAKAYYLRNVLHDYPDAKCVELLRLQVQALAPGSVILIDEMVIPNKGAHSHSTQIDVTMMASLASIERTEKQWHALIDSAGLRILEKKTYGVQTGESIIVLGP